MCFNLSIERQKGQKPYDNEFIKIMDCPQEIQILCLSKQNWMHIHCYTLENIIFSFKELQPLQFNKLCKFTSRAASSGQRISKFLFFFYKGEVELSAANSRKVESASSERLVSKIHTLCIHYMCIDTHTLCIHCMCIDR